MKMFVLQIIPIFLALLLSFWQHLILLSLKVTDEGSIAETDAWHLL